MAEPAIAEVMTAFEEFKAANDNRLKEIEKKGSADVVLVEKVDRVNAALDKLEGENQKRTAELLETKKALDAEKEHVDELEAALNRLSLKGSSDPAQRKQEL